MSSARVVTFTRFSPLVRIIAVVLLTWTALDLCTPGICALDNEDRRGTTHVSASSTSVAAQDTRDTSAPNLPAHVDDCFCCSRCVESTATVFVAVVSTTASLDIRLTLDAPASPAFPVDHPPQLLG